VCGCGCVGVWGWVSASFLAISITAVMKIDTGEVAWRTETSPWDERSSRPPVTYWDEPHKGSSNPTREGSMSLLSPASHWRPTRGRRSTLPNSIDGRPEAGWKGGDFRWEEVQVEGGNKGARQWCHSRARACKPTLPHTTSSPFLLHSPTVHMPMKANGRWLVAFGKELVASERIHLNRGLDPYWAPYCQKFWGVWSVYLAIRSQVSAAAAAASTGAAAAASHSLHPL